MTDSRETTDALNVPKMPYHEQHKFCTTRSPYRQGRKLTAMKVYTISDESVYLLFNRVPDLKIGTELGNMCKKFGRIEKIVPLPDYPHNQFETTYLVKYISIKCSRIAKKVIDGKNFFGGILHVCYAPEMETVEETREKLLERKREYSNIKSKNVKRERFSDIRRNQKFNFKVHTPMLKDLLLPNFSHPVIVDSSSSTNSNNSHQNFIPNIDSCNDKGDSHQDSAINKIAANERKRVKSTNPIEVGLHQFGKTKRLVSNKISAYNNKKRSSQVKSKSQSQPSIEELRGPISTRKVR